MTRPLLSVLVLLCGALALSGCVTFPQSIAANYAYGIFKDPDVNLREKIYAVVDYMVGRSGDFIKTGDTIDIMPLDRQGNEGLHTDFGVLVAEEIRTRLRALGYEARVVDPANPSSDQGKAKLSVTGHYARHHFDPLALDFDRPRIDLYLVLNNQRTGREITTFNQMMVIDRDLARMMEPEAQVMRTTAP